MFIIIRASFVAFQLQSNEISFVDLLELPTAEEEAELAGRPDFSAVVSEDYDENSNPWIAASKADCAVDGYKYCAGDSWKSFNHTMCKYCVSC